MGAIFAAHVSPVPPLTTSRGFAVQPCCLNDRQDSVAQALRWSEGAQLALDELPVNVLCLANELAKIQRASAVLVDGKRDLKAASVTLAVAQAGDVSPRDASKFAQGISLDEVQ